MLKPFLAEKILNPVEMGPKNGVFWESGCLSLRFWFLCPQKVLPCAEPRRLTYFASKSVRVSAVAFLKNPPPQKKKITESLCAEGREITHAQNRDP